MRQYMPCAAKLHILKPARDRTLEPVMVLTQDDIAARPGIERGKLIMIDAKKLRKHARNCDGLVRSHFTDVLSGSYAANEGR
jgi:hypothetical protein